MRSFGVIRVASNSLYYHFKMHKNNKSEDLIGLGNTTYAAPGRLANPGFWTCTSTHLGAFLAIN